MSCADVLASSGFSGESSKPREYCDPFEVAEVLSLCSVAARRSEKLGGFFKALAAKFVPRGKTGSLCVWCCNASSHREIGPECTVLCDVGFLCWCCDARSERDSVEETKLLPKGRLL